MFLEIEIPAKSLHANLAVVWFLFIVSMHVEGEVIYLVERLRAYATFVRLLLTMRQSVVLIISLLVKSLSTHLTHPRFVSKMNAHVRVQSGTSIERLSTLFTLMRPLLCVNDLVSAQRARLTEPLPARFAHERTRACMHGEMSREVVVRVKHFSADMTRKHFLVGVCGATFLVVVVLEGRCREGGFLEGRGCLAHVKPIGDVHVVRMFIVYNATRHIVVKNVRLGWFCAVVRIQES